MPPTSRLPNLQNASPSISGQVFHQLAILLGHLPSLVFVLDDTSTERYSLVWKEPPCTAILPQVLLKVGMCRDTYGSPWPCCSILKRGPAGTGRVRGGSGVLPCPQGRTRALPVCSELFVPQRHTAQLPQDSRRDFQTNLQLARKLGWRAAAWAAKLGKRVWMVVDGFYGKGALLKLARNLNIVPYQSAAEKCGLVAK